jgi:hypothetical protein
MVFDGGRLEDAYAFRRIRLRDHGIVQIGAEADKEGLSFLSCDQSVSNGPAARIPRSGLQCCARPRELSEFVTILAREAFGRL